MPWEHRGARHTACSMCMCMCMHVCMCVYMRMCMSRMHVAGRTEKERMPNCRSPGTSGTSLTRAMTVPKMVKKPTWLGLGLGLGLGSGLGVRLRVGADPNPTPNQAEDGEVTHRHEAAPAGSPCSRRPQARDAVHEESPVDQRAAHLRGQRCGFG